MGSHDVPEIIFYWPPYLHIAGVVMPLVLVALLLRTTNRSRSAWGMALPVIMLLVGIWGLEKSNVIHFTYSNDISIFLNVISYDGIQGMLFAMAFLLLLSDKLIGLTRVAALVYAVLILACAGVFVLFDVHAQRLDTYIIPAMLAYCTFASTTLAALTLAGIECRKRYTPLRFLIWFFIIFLIVAAIVQFVVPKLLLWEGIFLLLLLPFLVLLLWVPLYRRRFHAILRLPGMDFESPGAYNGDKTEEHEP